MSNETASEKQTPAVAGRLKRLVMWLKNKLHNHDWYWLDHEEWISLGRGKTNICTKCGDRREWYDT